MSEHSRSAGGHRRDHEIAERWRAVGLGLDAVWVVVLLLVVALWADVTFSDDPAFAARGYLRVLLAPAAAVAAVLAGWAVWSAVTLAQRQPAGWDPPVVTGALAMAVALLSVVPSSTIVQPLLWVGGLGLVSVVSGLLGERAWGRAARSAPELTVS